MNVGSIFTGVMQSRCLGLDAHSEYIDKMTLVMYVKHAFVMRKWTEAPRRSLTVTNGQKPPEEL